MNVLFYYDITGMFSVSMGVYLLFFFYFSSGARNVHLSIATVS